MPLSVANATLEWTSPLDPAEDKPFTLDWSAETTATGNTVSSSVWTLSSAATSAGVTKGTESNDNTTTTVWLKVAGGNQSDTNFDPTGTQYTIKNTMTDSASIIYERSIKFTVVQL